MSDIPNHSLVNDFPESRDLIRQLKQDDPEFARMAAEYHDLDHQVRGLEMRSVPTSDENFGELKKRRLLLKDELYAIIKKNHPELDVPD
ncbi:MAG: YdcH family protein [Exilibacterium sp.]